MDCPESDLPWYSSVAPSNAQTVAQAIANILLATGFQIHYSLTILQLDATNSAGKWMDTMMTNNLSEEPCHNSGTFSLYIALKFR